MSEQKHIRLLPKKKSTLSKPSKDPGGVWPPGQGCIPIK